MVEIYHSRAQNLKRWQLKLAGLCCCSVWWLNWKIFCVKSDKVLCFNTFELFYTFMAFQFFFFLKITTYYQNFWSYLQKTCQTWSIWDLYYAIVYLNNDCVFQKVKLPKQNIPSLLKKIKKNHDLLKYFGSPELCQCFGSLLVNMCTVNIDHTSNIGCNCPKLSYSHMIFWDSVVIRVNKCPNIWGFHCVTNVSS